MLCKGKYQEPVHKKQQPDKVDNGPVEYQDLKQALPEGNNVYARAAQPTQYTYGGSTQYTYGGTTQYTYGGTTQDYPNDVTDPQSGNEQSYCEP